MSHHVMTSALTTITLARMVAQKAGLSPEDAVYAIGLAIGTQDEAIRRIGRFIPLDVVLDTMVTEGKATPEKIKEAIAELKMVAEKTIPDAIKQHDEFFGKIEA